MRCNVETSLWVLGSIAAVAPFTTALPGLGAERLEKAALPPRVAARGGADLLLKRTRQTVDNPIVQKEFLILRWLGMIGPQWLPF